jgi:hypothetical protein
LELKLSILPFLLLVGDFAPALLANGKCFAFNLDVEFDVFAFAGVFPGVFTVFQLCCLRLAVSRFLLLRRLNKRLLGGGEGWVKVKLKIITDDLRLYG